MCLYTAASFSIRQLFRNFGLTMQRVSLLGRIVNISVLGKKAVLRRNVFTMEGPGKGNGVPCITVGDREHDEVTKLKDFNMDRGCQYIK
jgi:hypothetical protein